MINTSTTTLRSAAEVALGRQRSPQHAQGEHMVCYLRAANVKDGTLDLTDVQSMNFTPAEQRIFALRPGDVLVTEGSGSLSSVGASAVWRGEVDGMVCFQNTLLRIRPRAGVDGRYLEWWARSAFGSGVFASIASGANIYHLSAERVRALPINLPPLEEQRRIADFLDAETARMDKTIATARRMRAVLSERKSAHRALTLRGGHKSGGRYIHPLLGDLPNEWKILPLKRLVPRIGVGVVVDPSSYFADEGVPFLRGANILPDKIHLEDVRYISPSDSRKLWRSQLFEGDVVVVRAGDPGRAAVVTRELNGANCASVLVIKKGEILLPEYLAAYFNSALGAAYVDSVRYGAAQEQINVSHVVDFMVPVPSISEQKEILADLHRSAAPGIALDQLLAKQSAVLTERRQAVITAAVTGQIDVSTASGRGIEE